MKLIIVLMLALGVTIAWQTSVLSDEDRNVVMNKGAEEIRKNAWSPDQ